VSSLPARCYCKRAETCTRSSARPDPVRCRAQSEFRAARPVCQTQRRYQRLCRSILQGRWLRCGKAVQERVDERMIMTFLPFRAGKGGIIEPKKTKLPATDLPKSRGEVWVMIKWRSRIGRAPCARRRRRGSLAPAIDPTETWRRFAGAYIYSRIPVRWCGLTLFTLLDMRAVYGRSRALPGNRPSPNEQF